MEDVDVYGILRIVLQKLGNHFIVWRLDGSANLRVQGVDVLVHSLEIRTNTEGLRVFQECLKDYLVKEYYREDIDGTVAEFTIQGFPVEIIHNKYSLLHRVKKVTVQGIVVPVFPLKEAREFYAALGREKTVAVLDRHLG
jgi:hypothetical protein